MSHLAKSALLSLGLVVGVAAAAHAQSNSLASLPPGAVAAPPTEVTAPVPQSSNYPGVNPGKGWYNAAERQTLPVEQSGIYPGPNPGKGSYYHSAQTDAVQPSPQYIGPRPN